MHESALLHRAQEVGSGFERVGQRFCPLARFFRGRGLGARGGERNSSHTGAKDAPTPRPRASRRRTSQWRPGDGPDFTRARQALGRYGRFDPSRP